MSFINYNGKWVNEFFTTGSTVSGTTLNTITSSIFIPANTYTDGDFMEIDSMLYKNGTNGTWVWRIYCVSGSTPTFTGAIAIAQRSAVTTQTFATMSRRLYIRTADGTGTGLTLGTEVATTSGGLVDDYRNTTVSNLAIDWTNDLTIFGAIQNGSTLDQSTQYYLKIWEW